MTRDSIVVAIDGTNWVHVLWHALGGDAVRIRAAMLRRIELMQVTWPHIERLVVGFDAAPSFRHRLFPKYKHSRSTPAELKLLLATLQDELRRVAGVIVISEDGFEADDVLASVARVGAEVSRKVVLASPDKDIRQCLREHQVTILKHWKVDQGTIIPEWETASKLRAEYGLRPDQWIDYQTMVGDPGDDIPGLSFIGDQTARRLLASHGSLAAVLADPWKCDVTARQRQTLFRAAGKDAGTVDTIRRLVTLVDRVPFVEDALDLTAAATAQGGAA